MEAITKQFFLPVNPSVNSGKAPIIYPWENTNLFNLCQELFVLAKRTGYMQSFDEFKECFGAYLEASKSLVGIDDYTGEYIVTPLPTVEQVLHTQNSIMRDDIVINPISYHEVDNAAGGRTVTIG